MVVQQPYYGAVWFQPWSATPQRGVSGVATAAAVKTLATLAITRHTLLAGKRQMPEAKRRETECVAATDCGARAQLLARSLSWKNVAIPTDTSCS
jgi:hypothetical protein